MAGSEHELLGEAIAGNQEALTTLLERHSGEVRRSLAGKIAKRWRSVLSEDDVLQETYADAFLSIRRFAPQGERAFVRWLMKLAKNNLLDAARGLSSARQGGDRARLEPRSPEESYVDLLAQLSGTTTSPSGALARKEATQLLEGAIDRLPNTYQQVVRLYDLEGRSAEEVAKVLTCSMGAMYMRRARAHALLQELLGSESRF